MAKRARKASAATIQGSALVLDCGTDAGAAPTALPQRWQNFAPGLSAAEQVEQAEPASGAPQREQKRPVASEPHAGQRVDGSEPDGGEVIGRKLVDGPNICTLH
jgi:hypothetical protein